MLSRRARSRHPEPAPDPVLLAELGRLLTEEAALRRQLGEPPITDTLLIRWTPVVAAPASVSREPGRRSYAVAGAWLIGAVLRSRGRPG